MRLEEQKRSPVLGSLVRRLEPGSSDCAGLSFRYELLSVAAGLPW
jgi:hypothetical protein